MSEFVTISVSLPWISSNKSPPDHGSLVQKCNFLQHSFLFRFGKPLHVLQAVLTGKPKGEIQSSSERCSCHRGCLPNTVSQSGVAEKCSMVDTERKWDKNPYKVKWPGVVLLYMKAVLLKKKSKLFSLVHDFSLVSLSAFCNYAAAQNSARVAVKEEPAKRIKVHGKKTRYTVFNLFFVQHGRSILNCHLYFCELYINIQICSCFCNGTYK